MDDLGKDAFNQLMSALTKGIEEDTSKIVSGDEIKFPIEVSGIKSFRKTFKATVPVGSWVSIRPAADPKTYLGIHLGDLLIGVDYFYHTEKKSIEIFSNNNPAIYVPDLKRVVWGCESWWGIIKNPEGLKAITDADIQNIWYVKAFNELMQAEEERTKAAS